MVAMKARLKSAAARLLGPDYFEQRASRWRTKELAARLAANFDYDRARFAGQAAIVPDARDAEQLGSLIMMDCHRIEKGLALPAPRPGFGVEVVRRLIRNIRDYEARFGGSLATSASRVALREYRAHCDGHGKPVPEELAAFLADASEPGCIAGTKTVQRAEIERALEFDFDRFARARYSVRQYTGEPVSRDMMARAVSTALKSPSVCNRQSARVHIAFSRERIARVLSFQNGNAGFGDTLGAVVIVTTDIRAMNSLGERNQCWVDGGIFAMSLAYALHGLGLGACMLNWSQTRERDIALREAVGIPESEAIVTMIGVGHLPETFKVAVSPRREAAEIMNDLG